MKKSKDLTIWEFQKKIDLLEEKLIKKKRVEEQAFLQQRN